MHRTNFTSFDNDYPQSMITYMRHYGPHFNRRLCNFAVSLMTTLKDDKEVPIKEYTKDDIDLMLRINNIALKNNQLYDYIYVANMCKADFLGSSITDDKHVALYIKDVVDDIDAPDGIIFNRWYADMCYSGIAIDWEEML